METNTSRRLCGITIVRYNSKHMALLLGYFQNPRLIFGVKRKPVTVMKNISENSLLNGIIYAFFQCKKQNK